MLISYGEYWFPWYMRRLAEPPDNVMFVLKSMFQGINERAEVAESAETDQNAEHAEIASRLTPHAPDGARGFFKRRG